MTTALTNVVDGKSMPSARTLEFVDPSTGGVLAEAPRSGAAEVDAAMATADSATVESRRTTPSQRREAMLALADLVEEHRTIVEATCSGDPDLAATAPRAPRANTLVRLNHLAEPTCSGGS